MELLELQNKIKQAKKELNDLENQLNSFPSNTLMYRLVKGKHTIVLQPTKQVVNLQFNGWIVIDIKDVVDFILKNTN